jgi:hypothetical protein
MISAVLQRPTLVLNRNWQPVGVNTVARSLVKVWNETARIVDAADFRQYTWDDWTRLQPEEDEAVIHTRSQRLRVPEVIVLNSYDRVPSNAVTFSRRNIFKRDRFTCQYCGRQGRFVGVDRRVDEDARGFRVRRGARPRGTTACWRASTATPGRRTGLRSRRGCPCGGSRCVRTGSRCTPRTECGSTAGPGS